MIMSLHIAVCDDAKAEREYLPRWFASGENARCVYLLDSFESAEVFLFAYDGDKSCDITLLVFR
jgi:hypothetical protein